MDDYRAEAVMDELEELHRNLKLLHSSWLKLPPDHLTAPEENYPFQKPLDEFIPEVEHWKDSLHLFSYALGPRSWLPARHKILSGSPWSIKELRRSAWVPAKLDDARFLSAIRSVFASLQDLVFHLTHMDPKLRAIVSRHYPFPKPIDDLARDVEKWHSTVAKKLEAPLGEDW